MAAVAWRTDDPGRVLETAGGFLASDPVRHNVILTLLHSRLALREPGRYWVVELGGTAAGVVFQSPLHYPATVTPMPERVVVAAIDAIVPDRVHLPGVTGEAGTAACFAGHWTERARVGADPHLAQRIYEIDAVIERGRAGGRLRRVGRAERDLAVRWLDAFQTEIGEGHSDSFDVVNRRIAAGELWLWDDDGPVAVAGVFAPVASVARVGPVFTPPERRSRGYATALVAAVSAAVLDAGDRCILYTDLANPTSNAIYRAIGYRAVAEVLRYRFDAGR